MRNPITIIALLFIGGLIVITSSNSSIAGDKKIGVIVVDLQGDFTTFKKASLAVAGTDESSRHHHRQ